MDVVGLPLDPNVTLISTSLPNRCMDRGDRLATAGGNGVVKVWDAVTSDELLSLSGHGTCDGTARVYFLLLEDLKALAQYRVTRSLTDEECQRYLHVTECLSVGD